MSCHISKLYKTLLKLNDIYTHIIRKRAKYLNGYAFKEEVQMANIHMKR